MMYLEAFPSEFRLGFALLFAGITVAVCWRWPHAAGRWWLIAAAVVAVWQPLTGAALIQFGDRKYGSVQPQSWPVGDYWLIASLLIIYGQTLCPPAWTCRPARRWFINLLGSWGVFCLLAAGGSDTNATNELVGLVATFSAGLMGLGLAFGFWQAMQAGGQKDPWLTTAMNVGLALLVGWLVLIVLTAASSGYVWGAPFIVLGILGGSVVVGLGTTTVSHQPDPTEGSSAVQSTARPSVPPPDSSSSPKADAGTSPLPPTPASPRFSFVEFVVACFVMVFVAFFAVLLAAPHRGPLSPHFTTLGTREYLEDQGPVNRVLALGILVSAALFTVGSWKVGSRGFAIGALISGVLLALLALKLHS
jgi:hypothetical protein